MIKIKLSNRTNESYFIGECPNCNNKRTFSIEGYCTECSSLHEKLDINDRYLTPEQILETINNQTKKEEMKTRKTKLSFSKKAGKVAGTIVGATFGTAHLVLQTSADLVAASEGYLQEKITGEDAEKVALNRKKTTAEKQIKTAIKIVAFKDKLTPKKKAECQTV